uniref:Uncharacterized protein n=1 Tax=Culex tarsalis TaxID=7177 RepID=A0A1Q3FS69_CULTA
MSDIPVISITKEFSDEELDDVAKLNINDALTDTEDLIMEQDSVRYRKSPTKCGNALVDAILPTTNGSVTDVEDCTDSDEDEGEVKSAREAEITLDNFLDQGYVDETTNSGNKGAKPKTLTHCSSMATESTPHTLGIVLDASNALTDCEDLSDDDDSLGHVSIPDCPEDILTRANDNDAVAIHNVVKRRQDKHVHKQEAAEASSSESEEDSKVRHRKCHRKAEDRPKSEYENLMMSDEEMAGGACAKPSNRRSALFEAEELVMEGSDIEEDKPHAFPEINITFVSDDRDVPVDKPTRKRPASLAVQTPNADEAVTDVENLNSSDSEEETVTTRKRLMPRAVVKGGKVGGGTTDVEDFNDSEDNQDNELKNDLTSEFLPSPVREIAILKHDECGEQRQNVMPLNKGMLTVRTPDIEQALTDVEDMSDTEEVGEMYDSSKYTIESLPEMEGDNVYSSDHTRTNSGPTLEVTSPARDPVTDTEDLFFEQSASTGGSGSELRRRRKTKQCHSHGSSAGGSSAYQSQQSKGKKHLEMKCDTAAATTDVEDMYLSDDTAKKCGFERAKQRRATIQFSGLMATANDGDGKTDVEFLSGDELVCERSQSPQLHCHGYSSIVKTKERNGPIGHSVTNDVRPIPMIRKISPSPDTAQNCNTDVEDIQMGSDGEEHAVTYSRAQTATPFELTRESGSCEIYETSPRAKNELLDIKGMADGNQPEIHTDVESLDEVEQ